MIIIKKILKWTVCVLLTLAVLVALFYVVENTRGKRAWEQYTRECAARGEDIGDWLSLIPPPIPDEDNIAMAPIFLDLLVNPNRKKLHLPYVRFPTDTNTVQGAVWQTGVYRGLDPYRVALSNDNLLAALAVYNDDLREVEEVLKRPLFRYAGWDEVDSLTPEAPVTLVYNSLGWIYHLRSRARLEAGQPGDALEDIKTGFRIANIEKAAPSLFALSMRGYISNMMLEPVWLGICERVWNEQQLATLQGIIEEINLAEHMVLAVRFNRRLLASQLISRHWFSWIVGLSGTKSWDFNDMSYSYMIPTGWFYQNAVHLANFYGKRECMIHANKRCFDFSQWEYLDKATRCFPRVIYALATLAHEDFFSVVGMRAVLAQATLHQAAIACAIERYRLENMRIPERLDDLVPTYLAKIPCDPCDGHPMRYKLEDDGNAVIYSIGRNGIDDGGQFGVRKRNGADVVDIDSGDWIWRVAGAE